ncbi:protein IQ-DOMAIN 10-like [Humulus lupulus]|uniref:protein IQ-DOMAIN 10-like n=1 Tax=Humulus lupulus TaxID=3486 RepID=UPI002B406B78|nr:protein IQ-DOMAIN 10-like [Humulus lupulus]
MGCLSRIVKRRKSKQVNEHLVTEELNGSHRELSSSLNGGSKNESTTLSNQQMTAATKIQAAFRSFLAKKVLHNLRKSKVKETQESLEQDQTTDDEATFTMTSGVKGTGQAREFVRVHTVKDQTISALSHIHSWSRIQDQIKARRLSMVKEARIKQKKLENQMKLEAKIHELEVEWCGGLETMEEILSRIHQREEAAIKRERAMAYAFLHQWRANSSQYLGQASFSLGKEDWGWSWVERWVAARPWEIRVVSYPINSKKTQWNKHDQIKLNQSEKNISSSENSISQNGNCKNRKTCSTHPHQA